LSLSLEIASLDLCEVTSVLEDLNEGFLGQSLLSSLLDWADLLNCKLEEFFLGNVSADVFNGCSLSCYNFLLFYFLFVDSDGFPKLD